MKKLISIVTPVYNEEPIIAEFINTLYKVLLPLEQKYEFEIIFTDNASKDSTFSILEEFISKDKRIKALRFSRNIGLNRSIHYGLSHASGDAVILIMSDMEDPPSIIPQFIQHWEDGFEVVYGVMLSRKDSFILKRLRKIYYKIINKLSEFEIPENATEFRLTSKRINDEIIQFKDDNPYIRGLVAYLGFAQKKVLYHREKRSAGKSSFNYFDLLIFSINSLVTTTQAPTRAIVLIGLIITVLSSIHFLY